MRRRIFWMVAAVPAVLAAGGIGAVLSVPATRHAVSGLLHLPDRLPALLANSQVHYEPGAEAYARDVAALLPAAIKQIEAVHGRGFAHPAIVAVYATPEAFAAANGRGSAGGPTGPVGVTFYGRVNLSPELFQRQRYRLAAILTHELSHAHIQGSVGVIAYLRLPKWFKEGLAVMVSGGGGAEAISEEQALAAIERGEQLDIDDAGSLRNMIEFRLEKAAANKPPWYPIVMAYRQAGMFVTYLRDLDPPAFKLMMNVILNGRPFAEAVAAGYHVDAHSLWLKFVQAHVCAQSVAPAAISQHGASARPQGCAAAAAPLGQREFRAVSQDTAVPSHR